MEIHSYSDRFPISLIPSACPSPIFSTSLRLILRALFNLLQWLLQGFFLLLCIIAATLFLSPEWRYLILFAIVFWSLGAGIIQLLNVKVIS